MNKGKSKDEVTMPRSLAVGSEVLSTMTTRPARPISIIIITQHHKYYTVYVDTMLLKETWCFDQQRRDAVPPLWHYLMLLNEWRWRYKMRQNKSPHHIKHFHVNIGMNKLLKESGIVTMTGVKDISSCGHHFNRSSCYGQSMSFAIKAAQPCNRFGGHLICCCSMKI